MRTEPERPEFRVFSPVLVALVAAVRLGLLPRALGAQMSGAARVGVLSSTGPTGYEPFRRGLEELGWAPGRNLVFELVVNLQAARAIQLTLPQPLLSRADNVIE